MQLYPHWLDGEFVRISSKATGPRQNTLDMTRALKVHALLGTQLILSDVQVFDSAAILNLFGDKSAREFLDENKDFLGLKVDPDPKFGYTSFALAARGLLKTRQSQWNSSVFISNPEPIKRLADEIINEIQKSQKVDPQCTSNTAKTYNEYANLLEAVRQAVHYFGNNYSEQSLTAVRGKRTNYYKVLNDLSNERNLESTDRHSIEETLEFIDTKLGIENPDEKTARSIVRDKLHLIKNPLTRDRVWNNVVLAWNYAVQTTLQTDGGSSGILPGAVSPGSYLDLPSDTLVPIDLDKQNEPLIGLKAAPLLPVDIDAVTWDMISKVRKDEHTKDTFNDLTNARHSRNHEQITIMLSKHFKQIGEILYPTKTSIANYVITASVGFGVPAAVLALIGSPDIYKFIFPAGTLVSSVTQQIWKDTKPLRQRRALQSTLHKATVSVDK